MLGKLGKHLDREDLGRFVGLALGLGELRTVVWHLSHCGRCRRRLATVAPAGLELLRELTRGVELVDSSRDADYSTAFSNAWRTASEFASTLERDRRGAGELLTALLALPPAERRLTVEVDPGFGSFGLAECLLAESRRWWSEDNEVSIQLAELALAAADRLAASWPAERQPLLEDLRADAWASIATVRRVGCEFARAEEAILVAAAHLRRGSGEPMVRARVLNLTAALRTDQQRYDEAERLLVRVLAIYRHLGDLHLEGRTLVSRARIQAWQCEPAAAVRTLERAMERLDPDREPRLVQIAKHNLLVVLIDLGRTGEARKLLPEVRALTRRTGKRLDRVRLGWIEGRLAAETGRFEEAERKLLAARSRLIAERVATDAAEVSLELAAFYLDRGRYDEAKRLATEAVPIFQSRDIHREVVMALSVFERAALADTMTANLARELAGRLAGVPGAPTGRHDAPS